MIRLVFAVLVILALGACAAWLADHPGRLALDAAGRRIEMSLAAAAVILLLLVLLLATLYRLWLWLRRRPSAFGNSRARRRRRQGYEALTRGMVAVAAGDASEAQRLAGRAERLLDEPPLTLLLSAQAAQLGGDEAAAERHFTAMLARPETEFLGLRGLLAQAVRRNDRKRALELAKRARELRPATPWVLRELFALQVAEGHWSAAERTLSEMSRHKVVDGSEAKRRQAVLTHQLAREAEAAGLSQKALKLAEQAHRLAPGFVPGAVLAARLEAAVGRGRKAARVLSEAWAMTPHPELAEAYAMLHPDDDPARRRQRLEELAAYAQEHPESRLLRARAAAEAGDFAAARSEVEPLLQGRIGPRLARFMAELDEKQYGDGVSAREWLLRAAAAPPDLTWICGSCGWQGGTWDARCPSCGAFDALAWKEPASGLLPALPALPASTPVPAVIPQEVEKRAAG